MPSMALFSILNRFGSGAVPPEERKSELPTGKHYYGLTKEPKTFVPESNYAGIYAI